MHVGCGMLVETTKKLVSTIMLKFLEVCYENKVKICLQNKAISFHHCKSFLWQQSTKFVRGTKI